MKKILAICLMMVMVVSMSIPAFATPNGFISSPSGNPAPTLISFDASDEDCTAKLIITPYGDRQDLTDSIRTVFEKAYNEIAGSVDLTKLNADLAKIAADKNIAAKDLVVSELFDIHVTGCDYHEGHVDFDITLDADMLKHFVGLLHMKRDGLWELVTDAKVVNNGEHLSFSVDSFSPFAIVVDTSEDTPKSPQTGDNSVIHIYVIIMAVCTLAAIVIANMRKKQRV